MNLDHLPGICVGKYCSAPRGREIHRSDRRASPRGSWHGRTEWCSPASTPALTTCRAVSTSRPERRLKNRLLLYYLLPHTFLHGHVVSLLDVVGHLAVGVEHYGGITVPALVHTSVCPVRGPSHHAQFNSSKRTRKEVGLKTEPRY